MKNIQNLNACKKKVKMIFVTRHLLLPKQYVLPQMVFRIFSQKYYSTPPPAKKTLV